MEEMNSAQAIRFFVSFSSRDKEYVREIMAALKGQQLDFWDYSDVVEEIESGSSIDDRLIAEIDACTHMIVVISRNSTDLVNARFCRFELEYALRRTKPGVPHFIPVLINLDIRKNNFQYPYDYFEHTLCQKLDESSETIVHFTVQVCQLIGKVYVPPIEAHPDLPFWKLFRNEVEQMAHSNKTHVDLLMILGRFNEYYQKAGVKADRRDEMEESLFLIKYFLDTCKYRAKELVYLDSNGNKIQYRPFYPWIVRAVCEVELGKYDEAMESYEAAKTIKPDNQDVIGGIGTVYFQTHQYRKAAECFEQIIRNEPVEKTTNAKINLIITKQAMGDIISDGEKRFLFQVDVSQSPDDFKTAVFNAQATQYRISRDYVALEKHCNDIIGKNLHDAITYRFLQLSFLNRGMTERAREVIVKALEEAEHNPRLSKTMLNSFLRI